MARVVLVVCSALIGWALVEFGARAIFGPPASLAGRVVLFTQPNWQLWGRSLRYAPRQQIRTLALAGDVVEYDVTFKINNLGFIDSNDYVRLPPQNREHRYFFVGDSFTAGFHGGAPWVPELSKLAQRVDQRVEVYNGGVGATGFSQFAQLIESVGLELDFGRIVVPFITHDVYRSDWRPYRQNGLLFICPTVETVEQCVQNRPTQMLVLADTTIPSTGARQWVGEWRRERGLQLGPRSVLGRIREVTYVGSLWRRSRAPQAPPPGRGIHVRIGDVLASFRSGVAGRPVTFLHIPERDETRSGRYREDVSGAIRQAGYEYTSLLDACDFRREDYFAVDPHFNARGYDKLRTCVGRELGLL